MIWAFLSMAILIIIMSVWLIDSAFDNLRSINRGWVKVIAGLAWLVLLTIILIETTQLTVAVMEKIIQ
jgi:tetrahydromethanopterin S-methyltransferase subunit E